MGSIRGLVLGMYAATGVISFAAIFITKYC